MTCQWVEACDRIEFVAEKLKSDRFFVRRRRINFDHVATNAELPAGKVHVVTLIEHVDQTTKDGLAADYNLTDEIVKIAGESIQSQDLSIIENPWLLDAI